MSWFIYALGATLSWGAADIFYKSGTDDDDPYSHLKISVWVGLVMGAVSIVLIISSKVDMTGADILSGIFMYLPASLSYIISMIIGYVGLRYLEISIISPIQNASGAFAMLAMFVIFIFKGTIDSISGEFSGFDICGTLLIIAGVIALAIVEKCIDSKCHNKAEETHLANKALCLMFPLLYCLFDTIGTAADGVILSSKSGMRLGELEVLVLYGLTFMLIGVASYVYIWVKTGRPYNCLKPREAGRKGAAAVAEQLGQVFYVYAMSMKPLIAAPMIASYCIVSVILGRIVIGEKLMIKQYACVVAVIAGIVLLGISEGLA